MAKDGTKKKMRSPKKFLEERFDSIKEKDPGKAGRIENRPSGDIYGLRPALTVYAGTTQKVVFKNGIYQHGVGNA
jgi:hypothetical protein